MFFTCVVLANCKESDRYEDIYSHPDPECVSQCPFGYHDPENKCYPIASQNPKNDEKLFGECFPTGINNGI